MTGVTLVLGGVKILNHSEDINEKEKISGSFQSVTEVLQSYSKAARTHLLILRPTMAMQDILNLNRILTMSIAVREDGIYHINALI